MTKVTLLVPRCRALTKFCDYLNDLFPFSTCFLIAGAILSFLSFSIMLSAWSCKHQIVTQPDGDPGHLQPPGLLLGLEGDEAVALADPSPVLDDLGLLHVPEGGEERVELGLGGGGADAAHKHPAIFWSKLELLLMYSSTPFAVELCILHWHWTAVIKEYLCKNNSWQREINYDICGPISSAHRSRTSAQEYSNLGRRDPRHGSRGSENASQV